MYSKGWETRRANAAKLGVSPHQFKKPESKAAERIKLIGKVRRKPVIADALAPQAEAQAINAVRDDWRRVSGVEAMLAGDNRGMPGRGDIIGGYDDQMTAKLMKLARKRGGDILVKTEIQQMIGAAHHNGQRDADILATKRLIESQQAMADRVVCGFIAEVEAVQNQYNGLPPGMTFAVSAFNVTKIIDALNKAGYTAQGKR